MVRSTKKPPARKGSGRTLREIAALEQLLRDIDALRRQVGNLLAKEYRRADASDPHIDWAAHGKLMDQRQAAKLEKRETKRANASKPRKRVTDKGRPISKEELVAFKSQFKSDHPDAKRGWMKAARFEFGITQKTLKKRWAE